MDIDHWPERLFTPSLTELHERRRRNDRRTDIFRSRPRANKGCWGHSRDEDSERRRKIARGLAGICVANSGLFLQPGIMTQRNGISTNFPYQACDSDTLERSSILEVARTDTATTLRNSLVIACNYSGLVMEVALLQE